MTTVLFQTNVHYSTTVKGNIALGDVTVEPSQLEIESAARASGAEATVEHLPERYESLLGNWFPGGTDLSVGEWQRIALARAFLRQAHLILLDEPTSAMDPWAESDWLGRLLKRAAGHTVVIITHRFTTAMYADVIHVMQEGRIVESGSHEELVARAGRYAESWAAHMREREQRRNSDATPALKCRVERHDRLVCSDLKFAEYATSLPNNDNKAWGGRSAASGTHQLSMSPRRLGGSQSIMIFGTNPLPPHSRALSFSYCALGFATLHPRLYAVACSAGWSRYSANFRVTRLVRRIWFRGR